MKEERRIRIIMIKADKERRNKKKEERIIREKKEEANKISIWGTCWS